MPAMPNFLDRYAPRTTTLRRLLFAAASVTLVACEEVSTEAESYTPVATSIDIADPGVVRDGDVITLNATVKDQRQKPMNNVPVQFVTVDQSVAVVSGGNVLTALREGTTELVAVAGTVQKRRPLAIVLHPATALEVPNPTVSLLLNGQQRITPTLRGLGGRVLTGRPLTWESADPSVARVDAQGLVTAVGTGATTVTVRYGWSLSSTVVVRVAALATRYAVIGVHGAPLPVNVHEELVTRDDGSTFTLIDRIESGVVTVGDRYQVNLTLAYVERYEFQGNTIERVIRRRTVFDEGSVLYNWLDGTGRFNSTEVGGLTHEILPTVIGPRLMFRIAGTNDIWGLGLRLQQ